MRKIEGPRSEKEFRLMQLEPGLYWFKQGDNWDIGQWCKYDGYGGCFWTLGNDSEIMIDDYWTLEMRGIEEIDERRIEREPTVDEKNAKNDITPESSKQKEIEMRAELNRIIAIAWRV